MKKLVLGLLCGFALGCNQSAVPDSSGNTSTEPSTTHTANKPVAENEPVDRANTGLNVRDRQDIAKTPLDQNENKTDINITADIRRRVVDTKMSSNAHNVKIITQDGKVTLRGPVKTAEEKQKIEEIALAVAGADNVDSQLEVNND